MDFQIYVGIILFLIGTLGFVIRRNIIVCFMCIELMLNSVNLIFVTYSHQLKSAIGLMYAFIIMAVAAAEVAIGLAIIIMIHRLKNTVDMDQLNILKG